MVSVDQRAKLCTAEMSAGVLSVPGVREHDMMESKGVNAGDPVLSQICEHRSQTKKARRPSRSTGSQTDHSSPD